MGAAVVVSSWGGKSFNWAVLPQFLWRCLCSWGNTSTTGTALRPTTWPRPWLTYRSRWRFDDLTLAGVEIHTLKKPFSSAGDVSDHVLQHSVLDDRAACRGRSLRALRGPVNIHSPGGPVAGPANRSCIYFSAGLKNPQSLPQRIWKITILKLFVFF